LLSGLSDSGFHSLSQDVALELGKDRKHSSHTTVLDSTSCPEISVQRAILYRFADVRTFYSLLPFQISQRPAYFQYSIIGSR
jgi:hypothetical protein